MDLAERLKFQARGFSLCDPHLLLNGLTPDVVRADLICPGRERNFESSRVVCISRSRISAGTNLENGASDGISVGIVYSGRERSGFTFVFSHDTDRFRRRTPHRQESLDL